MGVLVSGSGTNLQALLDDPEIDVVAVASDKADARGLERAAAAGVETGVFARADHADREARDAAIAEWLHDRGVELVVLAGYMALLTSPFLSRFPNAVVNVHPSLLPAFPGVRAIEQALDYGVKVFGVTVHFVDDDGGVDTGPILMQEPVELSYAPDIARVEREIHAVEHRLLPEAIRLIARGAVRLDPSNSRRVLVGEGSGARR